MGTVARPAGPWRRSVQGRLAGAMWPIPVVGNARGHLAEAFEAKSGSGRGTLPMQHGGMGP